MLLLFSSCSGGDKAVVDTIAERDSLPIMDTRGVMVLISGSGVTRYRVNTEGRPISDKKKPSYWAFEKGIYLEQFDSLFHVDASIEADTTYYYDCDQLQKLAGNIDTKSLRGDHVSTGSLYWDEATKKVYTGKLIQMEQPDQMITGYGLGLDDQSLRPVVHNTASVLCVDQDAEKTEADFVNQS